MNNSFLDKPQALISAVSPLALSTVSSVICLEIPLQGIPETFHCPAIPNKSSHRDSAPHCGSALGKGGRLAFVFLYSLSNSQEHGPLAQKLKRDRSPTSTLCSPNFSGSAFSACKQIFQPYPYPQILKHYGAQSYKGYLSKQFSKNTKSRKQVMNLQIIGWEQNTGVFD